MQVYIPVFRLAQSGGVERYTWKVGAVLAARGHDVTFVAPAHGAVPPPGAKLVVVGGLRSSHTIAHVVDFATFALRGTLAVRHRPLDTVVYRPVGGAFGGGVATAHSCHAAWLRDRDRALGPSPRTALDRILLAQERATLRARRVVPTTVSLPCARDLAEHHSLDPEAITVAPPAIDPAELHPASPDARLAARKAFGIDAPSALVVGTVANHAFTRKRVDVTIRAAAACGATLLVAGRPDVRTGFHEQLATELGADVRFLGAVTDMAAFYRAIDVLSLPSVHESYGMAAHEAMASGVATVVSAACGITSTFTDGQEALVIDGGDVEELVAELRRLQDPVVRTEQGVRGVAWAQRRTWDDVVDDLAPALEAAAAAG